MQYNARMREYEFVYPMSKEQMEANKTEYNSVVVSVGYEMGGMNYFTGSRKPRCYYLHAKPMSVSATSRQSILLGSGFEAGVGVVIKETQRFNQKELEKIANKVNFEAVGGWYADRKIEEMQKHLEEVRK